MREEYEGREAAKYAFYKETLTVSRADNYTKCSISGQSTVHVVPQ
jgi:hypothetical protein